VNHLVNLIVGKLIERLTPLLLDALTKLGQQLLEKIVALLPVIVAASTKAITEQLASKLPLPNLPELAEKIRADASAVLPDDVDLPFISDWGEKVLGIDLSDLITGRRA
jgi:hypothetical protein